MILGGLLDPNACVSCVWMWGNAVLLECFSARSISICFEPGRFERVRERATIHLLYIFQGKAGLSLVSSPAAPTSHPLTPTAPLHTHPTTDARALSAVRLVGLQVASRDNTLAHQAISHHFTTIIIIVKPKHGLPRPCPPFHQHHHHHQRPPPRSSMFTMPG